MFGSRVQEENETFEQFVTELKTLMKDCEYLAEIQDELIRDHIVFGVRSSKIREKMILEGSDLTLDKCMDIANTYELSVPQSQAIGNQTSPGAAVDSLSYLNRGRGRGKRRNTRQSRDQYTRQSRDQFTRQSRDQHMRQSRDQNMRRSWDQNMRQSRDQMQNCQYCGNKLHKHKTECPAYGKQCHKCSKYNHFAKLCKSVKSVHEVTSEQTDYDSDCYDDDTMDSFFVHTVGLKSSSHSDQVFVKVSVGISNNSLEIDCKIDTGSQINCLPISIYKSLKLDFPLKPSNATLTAYSGD